jgi:hypothetical protein
MKMMTDADPKFLGSTPVVVHPAGRFVAFVPAKVMVVPSLRNAVTAIPRPLNGLNVIVGVDVEVVPA